MSKQSNDGVKKHYSNIPLRMGGEQMIDQVYNRTLFGKLVDEYINKSRNAKILDVGCGAYAKNIHLLEKYMNADCSNSLYGYDISHPTICCASEIFYKAIFLVANTEKLPFLDKEFNPDCPDGLLN